MNLFLKNATDLNIYYAQYGTKISKKDVLSIIRKKVSKHDRLYFIVSNENLGGDFLPGVHKFLHIIYTFNGILYDEVINELEPLIIPKPKIINNTIIKKSNCIPLSAIFLIVLILILWKEIKNG